MKYTIRKHVPNSSNLTFWQSSIWRDIITESGQAIEAFYFGDEENFVLVEIRTLGLHQRGAFILGYSSGQFGGDLGDLIRELTPVLMRRGVIFLQIEPLGEEVELGMTSSYRSFLTPFTRTIDLSRSIEEIYDGMHEKGRYNIRLSEKRGVTVEREEPTVKNIDIFYYVLSRTTERHGFSQNRREYYRIFIEQITEKNNGGLYFAYDDKKEVIAASIGVFTAERAIYYYGASMSSPEVKRLMPSYILQWKMIQDAKVYGSRMYDFLGIANPEYEHDALIGVSRFKEKFGGVIERLPQKKIFPLSWKYRLFMKIYHLKNKYGL